MRRLELGIKVLDSFANQYWFALRARKWFA